MREVGKVVEVRGEFVKVEIEPKAVCEHCTSKSMCYFGPNKKMYTEAVNDIHAKVGDIVEIEMSPKSVIATSFIIFVFPVIIFIVAYLLFSLISENIGILCGFIFFVIYFIFLKKVDKALSKKRKLKPVVKRKYIAP